MPTPYVKKIAKDTGKSVAELERLWDRAKEEAAKAGHKNDYAYIMGIFKRMAGIAEAYVRLAASSIQDTVTAERRRLEKLTIEVEATPEAMTTLVNLLAAIEYNTQVGHSATIGAFFDGDGADKVRVSGLPKNEGAEMAKACSAYGDDVAAIIGTSTAHSLTDFYVDDQDGNTVKAFKRVTVYRSTD